MNRSATSGAMCTLAVAVLSCACAAAAAGAAEYVWIEGERPTSKNVEARGVGWGNEQYLSEKAWLHLSIDKDLDRAVPAGGAIFAYDFQVAQGGRYEVWNRIGFEFVRSPFSWRIDQGAWQDVQPTDLTTDLMEISFWCEVAWLKMGSADLAPGKHRLEIRLQAPHQAAEGEAAEGQKGEKGEKGGKGPRRILYASDCLCLYRGAFRPNGPFKPDQAWQDEMDKAAANQVFEILEVPEVSDRKPPAGPPTAGPAERVAKSLAGLWQIARFDEQEIEDRTGPIKALPAAEELHWKAIAVPGDRNKLRPELVFNHRYFYRTRVRVPAELKGRAFFLHFPSVNMIATVFVKGVKGAKGVNGVQCGWTKAPLAIWDCDVTKAIRPGEVNEIWVGVKDTYYAVARDTRRHFNIPADLMDRNQGVSMTFDLPVWNHRQNGILEAPSLVACGPVYASDVFAVPSVAKKELGLEITLANPGPADATATVANEVVPLAGGAAEKTFAPTQVKVAAGKEQVIRLAEGWANPRLWWPDDPHQYVVVTTVSLGGKAVDVRRTKFGFRQWTWDGPQFRLNGVPWQGRADLTHHHTRDPKAAVEAWRRHGQTMFRFWDTSWGGLDQVQTLDFLDAQGVPVRRSGIFDGEMASYGLTEEVELDGKKVRRARNDLFDNWLVQLVAQVRGERNHPSVFIWSIENEIVYINSLNLGQAQWVEPAVAAVAGRIMALDPTRPVMVDGGNALMDGPLPVNGGHYVETDQRDYPDEAYTLDIAYSTKQRGAWPMVKGRPIFLGESFFARGHNPGWFAGVGGEAAFLGRSETIRPCGLYAKMLSEGYRWGGLAAFHFWFGDEDATLHYNAWQPVCALCRQWNWTFGGGRTIPRTLKVLNDTRQTDPVELAWQFRLEDRLIQEGRRTCRIPPGGAEQVDLALGIPPVANRTGGQFIMTCSRGGKEVFREVKDAWVIDAEGAPVPKTAKADLLVLDPEGAVKKRLAARRIEFTEVARFEDIPQQARVVVVGRDALTGRQATDPRWLSLAAAGGRVLVLEQKTPLHYQATPADFEPTDHVGRIAFAENLAHPIFDQLDQADFSTWSGDHVVYRNPYGKASRGAKSLAQCDLELSCSAIAECPVNDGLLLLCQMVVGEKLPGDPVAQRLFDNMVNYLATYKVVRKATAVAMADDSPAAKMLASSGLKYDKAADAVAAISDGRHQIVIAEATPANLKALAAAADRLKAFAAAGGWLMLWGLTPEGLADFNGLVGVEHLIRPFEMERVTLPPVRDPVMSGLTMRDVVMESGQKIMAHAGDKFLADDIFTFVVDCDEIGPFCQVPGPQYWNQADAGPGADHWPRNMFNGFVTADSWKYVFSILLFKNEPTKWTIKLPREETITEFGIALNAIYHRVTKVNLYFDDDPAPVTLTTRPDDSRQLFSTGARKAKAITVELADWQKTGTQDVVGVDNIWIRVQRSDEFRRKVKPLLNLGAMVKYPMGQGGIILSQLRVLPNEPVPVNAQKKRTIISTILRNLGAVYAGGQVLSTANLRFQPIGFAEQSNQYLTRDRGWFDPDRDLGHVPTGEQRLAGVTFAIHDFKTSPVPGCIMLAGPGARGKLAREFIGLKVDRKADALFFLHAFKRTGEWRPRRGDEEPPPVFVYVVHYADGQTADVPILYGRSVDHWIGKDPKGLKDAALAWAAKFPGDDSGDCAAVYMMQWTNPRPDAIIRTIDLKYDDKTGSRYGVPAWLGLTAGVAAR